MDEPGDDDDGDGLRFAPFEEDLEPRIELDGCSTLSPSSKWRDAHNALSLRNCLVSSNDLLAETEAIISLKPSWNVVRPLRMSELISRRRFNPNPSSSVAQSLESRVVIVPSNCTRRPRRESARCCVG